MLEAIFGNREARLRRKFEQAARIAPSGPLADYYAAGLPAYETPLAEVALMAIDLETDGLNFTQSAILEAGLVEMRDRRIISGTARRIRLRPPGDLEPGSVVIHGLTDDALLDAQDEADALAELLPLLTGKVPVAHFAEIEAGFLDAACRRVYGAPFVAPYICTMQLENRWFPRTRAADGLRLAKLRAAYRLPAYRGHDGLVDALACGELLLAQIAHHRHDDLLLGDVLRR